MTTTPPHDSPLPPAQKVRQITAQVKNSEENQDATTDPIKCTKELPKKTTTIYVALTIDDGPRKTVTPKFIEYLNSKKIPATWYIVKQNVEEWGKEQYYQEARQLVAAGHEIAIHEAISESQRGQAELVEKGLEHVTPIPGRIKNAYRDIGDWADHLRAFKKELEDSGLTISFYRPPGGLHTELMHFVDFVAKQSGQKGVNDKILDKTAREIIRMINAGEMGSISRLPIFATFIKKDTETSQRLSEPFAFSDPGQLVTTFIETIEANRLKLWGSERILREDKHEAINWIGVQSWISLIGPGESNFVQCLNTGIGRLAPRFKSATNSTIMPFVVILTHDNNLNQYRELQKEIEAALALPEFHQWRTLTSQDKNRPRRFCHRFELKFVTMSELYEIVSKGG